MKTIRIFISSPGDVAEERDRARQVVEGLRRRYARHFFLKPVLWEELPLQADMSFQQGIDLVLSDDEGIDIAVFILWSRLGSPVGPLVRKTDGSTYRSGTEREFDLMLQARQQSREKTGNARPHILLYTRRDDSSFEERLRGRSTTEMKELVQQKSLVESFISEDFHDAATRTNARAYHNFDRPVTFSQRLRTHLTELLDSMAGGGIAEVVWDTEKQGPPYLGLEAFQPRHAEVFFGREDEILEVRHALREQARNGCAFVLLFGSSGSGKSSLARAGVLPEILKNEIDDQVVAWRTLIVTPSELLPDPISSFVHLLGGEGVLPELCSDETCPDDIATELGHNPDSAFKLCIKPAFIRAAKRTKGGVRVLLVLDQLEEFFTTAAIAAESRADFFAVAETLARSGFVWVVATARSDFNPQFQTEPTLVRLKAGLGTVDVLPPAPDALRRLIEEPARLAGLSFEKKAGHTLADIILRDTIGQPDALPLLEYALDQLFKAMSVQRQLTFAAYEKMGGVEGALGQKAEAEFIKLPKEAQDAFEEVMNTLVSVDADSESQPISHTTRLADVTNTAPKKALVDALVKARLLTAGTRRGKTATENDCTPVVRVAHEALLRRWERLVSWIAANREYLRLRARVEQSQARWQQSTRDRSLLLPPGLPLEEGNKLLREAPGLLTNNTTAYIQQSEAHNEAATIRSRKLRRIVTSVLATLLLLAISGGVFAWVQRDQAQAALKEQRRMSFEAVVRNAEADDQKGVSAKVIAALEPYLSERELAQHPLRKQAETLVEKARDGYKRFATVAEQLKSDRKAGDAVVLDLGQGVMLEMVLIPAGKFMMGSPETENGRYTNETQHEVTITKPFYMGKFHVTQEQYEVVMGTNPSRFKGRPKNPVEQLTWLDAVAFCKKVENQSGVSQVHLALPTEAQWEYACRAGTQTRFYFGDDESELEQYAWYAKNAGDYAPGYGTHPVGEKNKPNRFGLHDMHGNVFQWCQDWFDSEYYVNSPKVDPPGPEKGEFVKSIKSTARVLRGGCYYTSPEFCRTAMRSVYEHDLRVNSGLGFRVVAKVP